MKLLRPRKAHLRLGALGEQSACKLLKAKNYQILCRNFRNHYGELDIVALDGTTLVFVEVKTLRSKKFSRPERNLSHRQKQRNYRAGIAYLNKIGNPAVNFRFDLIEVIRGFFTIQEICHWTNNYTKEH